MNSRPNKETYVLKETIAEALAALTLPPMVTAVADGDDGVRLSVDGEPFGYALGTSISCTSRYGLQTAAEIADDTLNYAAGMIGYGFESAVRIGGSPWKQSNSNRTFNVHPAPVEIPPPVVHVKVEAPVVHISPAFDLPAPVVNIEPAQIHLAPARRVRKRVIRDRDTGLMLGMVEEDEPDAAG